MTKSRNTFLQTVGEILDVLGGDTAVAKRFGYADCRAVWNWRAHGYFPASTYVAWQKILKDKHISAPASLWRQREAVR